MRPGEIDHLEVGEDGEYDFSAPHGPATTDFPGDSWTQRLAHRPGENRRRSPRERALVKGLTVAASASALLREAAAVHGEATYGVGFGRLHPCLPLPHRQVADVAPPRSCMREASNRTGGPGGVTSLSALSPWRSAVPARAGQRWARRRRRSDTGLHGSARQTDRAEAGNPVPPLRRRPRPTGMRIASMRELLSTCNHRRGARATGRTWRVWTAYGIRETSTIGTSRFAECRRRDGGPRGAPCFSVVDLQE